MQTFDTISIYIQCKRLIRLVYTYKLMHVSISGLLLFQETDIGQRALVRGSISVEG